jgi:hypothetical protein
MLASKNNVFGVVCAVLFVGTLGIPTSAHAGFLGKLTKAAIYPVKKLGSNTSVDTHKALDKNSVEKAPNSAGTNQKVIVKPDGHKRPAS